MPNAHVMHLPTLLPRALIRAARVAGCAALAPVAALIAIATAAPPAAAAAAPSAPMCAPSGLVVWLDTQGSGALGSVYYRLELTNLSGRTCTLRGYPGVSAVDLRGHQLGSAASRDRSRQSRVVRLASGASATALLRILNAGNFPHSSCRPVSAAGVRVYAPNGSTSKVVPFPFSACSRRGPVYLTVRAVQKG